MSSLKPFVCSNGDPRITFDSQISVLVTVAILEEYCIASAVMQWLFYSGERIMAYGPLLCISDKVI